MAPKSLTPRELKAEYFNDSCPSDALYKVSQNTHHHRNCLSKIYPCQISILSQINYMYRVL